MWFYHLHYEQFGMIRLQLGETCMDGMFLIVRKMCRLQNRKYLMAFWSFLRLQRILCKHGPFWLFSRFVFNFGHCFYKIKIKLDWTSPVQLEAPQNKRALVFQKIEILFFKINRKLIESMSVLRDRPFSNRLAFWGLFPNFVSIISPELLFRFWNGFFQMNRIKH